MGTSAPGDSCGPNSVTACSGPPEYPLSEAPSSPGFLTLLRGIPTSPAFEEEWEACARKGRLQASEVLSEWSLCPQPALSGVHSR